MRHKRRMRRPFDAPGDPKRVAKLWPIGIAPNRAVVDDQWSLCVGITQEIRFGRLFDRRIGHIAGPVGVHPGPIHPHQHEEVDVIEVSKRCGMSHDTRSVVGTKPRGDTFSLRSNGVDGGSAHMKTNVHPCVLLPFF